MTTTTISYKDYNLKVKYNYYPSSPATYDNDDRSESIEISSIYLGEYDITGLLEDQMEDIEKVIYKDNRE